MAGPDVVFFPRVDGVSPAPQKEKTKKRVRKRGSSISERSGSQKKREDVFKDTYSLG